jgi:Flp pilus assembly protein TadD
VSGTTCPAPDPDCGDPCGSEGHCLEACASRDPDCSAPKAAGETCTRAFDCAVAASCVSGVCRELCDATAAGACGQGADCVRLTPEIAVCEAHPDDGGGGGCSTVPAGWQGRRWPAGAPWLALLLLLVVPGLRRSPRRRRVGLGLVLVFFLPGLARALPAAPAAALTGGDIAFAAGRYHEAARAYADAARADADSADARYRLGVALAAAGDLEGAVAAWQSVLELEPVHPLARRNLDLVRLRRPVPAAPDPARVAARARALIDTGRAASALLVLDTVSPSPDLLALRAEALCLAGDAPAALEAARALLALEPASARAAALLGAAHRVAGDERRARYFEGLRPVREP